MGHRILVATPAGIDDEQTQAMLERAKRQLKQFHYEPVEIQMDLMSILMEHYKKLPPDTKINQNMLFAGSMMLQASSCEGIYMALGWEKDMTLLLLNMLASYYNIEVMYEEKPIET